MIDPLHVRILTSLEELVALRADWSGLEAASSARLPFQTWEWTVAWWLHLREERIGVRDELRVCVVQTAGGEVVAIAPLILTHRPSVGPLRFRYLQFIGADPHITEIRGMLCQPGREAESLSALQRALASRAEEWDWIAWDGLREDPEGTDALTEVESKPQFVLPLSPTWQEMKAGLKRNVKESLRRCDNSLKRDGLTSRLEVVEQPQAMQSALDDFFALHRARARLRSGPTHADVFAAAQARAFLVDVCERLAERGVARVFRLWVDDRLVATRVGFELNGMLYLYYSGWEPGYARYSVMTKLLSEAIQDAIERRVHCVHLSTGRDVSKTRWGPDELTVVRGVQLSPRTSSRQLYSAYHLARRLASSQLVRALAPAALLRRSGGTVPPVAHTQPAFETALSPSPAASNS
jgi:CelD/BcsL family acetyltransferase involved in cellulose biosynthesis